MNYSFLSIALIFLFCSCVTSASQRLSEIGKQEDKLVAQYVEAKAAGNEDLAATLKGLMVRKAEESKTLVVAEAKDREESGRVRGDLISLGMGVLNTVIGVGLSIGKKSLGVPS